MAVTRDGDLVIVDAETRHLPAITAIYGHHVVHGVSSFEEDAPDLAEMRRRYDEQRAAGFPFLVALDARDEVLGYAYAARFRARSAFRFTVEDSIYVAPEHLRRGIGRALLGRLVDCCASLGYRQMVAVVGDSANTGSIGLHASQGFTRAGLLPAVGYKFDRWIDCVLMQRQLGDDHPSAVPAASSETRGTEP